MTKEKKPPKQILVRLEGRPNMERIYKWLEAQNNASLSTLSMINHMIDRFGYVDIMDHEVSKKLYQELLHFNAGENVSSSFVESPREVVETTLKPSDPVIEVHNDPNKEEEKTISQPLNNASDSPKEKNKHKDIDISSF